MRTKRTCAQYLTYLRQTLIPDLRESGSDATADDFEEAATLIEMLLAYADELKQIVKRG